MGQELTARTKYRGLLKRRLAPVSSATALPPPGAAVTRDGVEVGVLRSTNGGLGLALLRIDAIGEGLSCGGPIEAHRPAWMPTPE